MITLFIIVLIVAGILALTFAPIILYFVHKDEETKRDKVIGEIIETNIDNGYGEVYEEMEEKHGSVKNLLERLRRKGYDV